LPYWEKALAAASQAFGKDSANAASVLNNLAMAYQGTSEYAKAERHYQRSMTIREARLGKDHGDVAQSLMNIGVMYVQMGQYAKAEPLYQRSLRIYEANRDDLNAAAVLVNFGNLYMATGEYAKAERQHQRSLQIREARLGKDKHLLVSPDSRQGPEQEHQATRRRPGRGRPDRGKFKFPKSNRVGHGSRRFDFRRRLLRDWHQARM